MQDFVAAEPAQWLPADVSKALENSSLELADDISGGDGPAFDMAAELGSFSGWSVVVATRAGDTCVGLLNRAADYLGLNCVRSDATARPLWVAVEASKLAPVPVAVALMPATVDLQDSTPGVSTLKGFDSVATIVGAGATLMVSIADTAGNTIRIGGEDQ